MTSPQSIAAQSGTGSSSDILSRVKRLLPTGWFSSTASVRDAVVGALSDAASWCYALTGYAKAQQRLATAYGIWLDILCYDFLGPYLTRGALNDGAFRALIKATILQERVTRAGMIAAVTAITSKAPQVFEPWNTGDTGAYSSSSATGFKCGQFGYGVGTGGYGNMNLPGQAFMILHRGVPGGVPTVGGYGSPNAGYGVGQREYVGPYIQQVDIPDSVILDVVNKTKPTGTTMWVAFQ